MAGVAPSLSLPRRYVCPPRLPCLLPRLYVAENVHTMLLRVLQPRNRAPRTQKLMFPLQRTKDCLLVVLERTQSYQRLSTCSVGENPELSKEED